jgi:Putative peptidoglycan binding domain
MKTKTIFSLVSLALFAAVSPTLEARVGGGGGGGFGGGGHFGGGGFGGGHFGGGGFSGGHFGGGGGFHSGGTPMGGFHSGGLGGARYSFATGPTYGRPVYVRPRGITSSTPRPPAVGRQQGSVGSTGNHLAPFYHSPAAIRPSDRPVESARNHIFARQPEKAHHDWDHRSAHYWSGHWWAWDGYNWIGLDAGFFPWDYFPYYAYDYYPYDYYPGYYADVEPYYYNDGVSDYVPTSDPNVVAVQKDLANLGYYHGSIDGIYGRDTRDAVARYQTDYNLSVTGTLTMQTLQALGVSQATPS